MRPEFDIGYFDEIETFDAGVRPCLIVAFEEQEQDFLLDDAIGSNLQELVVDYCRDVGGGRLLSGQF